MARKRKPRRAPDTGIIRPLPGGRAKAAYPKPGGGYWTRNCDSVPDAEAWLASFEERKKAKAALVGGQQTLRAWLHRWVNSRPAHLKPTTLHDYAYKLGMLGALAEVRLVDLMPDQIDDALAELARSQADTTVRQVRGLLNRALREAVRKRYILFNPADAERTSRPPAKERTRLNASHARVLAERDTGFYRAAWPLLLCCGLRAGELCGLRLTDLDLEKCVLHVRVQVTDLAGDAVEQTPKTAASVRSIPFPRGLVPVLRRHLAAREKRAARALKEGTWQDAGRVFPGKSGRNLNPTSLRHALRRATDTLKLPPLTTHELRHTCGGLLEHVGAPEHIIAGMFGHGPRVVTRRYAPPTVDTMRPWVEQVWREITSAPPPAEQLAQ